jgi:hydroxypyruvate isomerase
MNKIFDRFSAGIVLSELAPDMWHKQGKTYQALKQAVNQSIFRAFLILDVPFEKERNEIAQLVNENKLSLCYCLTGAIETESIELGSLNEQYRLWSIKQVCEHLMRASQTGATSLQIISEQANPQINLRKQQLKALEKSLFSIAEFASDKNIEIVIEQLDVFAHKKRAFGLGTEAAEIFGRLRKKHENAGLCFDIAHSLLNGEDIFEMIKLNRDNISMIHICNPCLEPDSPSYGDTHIKFDAESTVNEELISRVIKHYIQITPEDKKREVYLELYNHNEPLEVALNYCEKVLINSVNLIADENREKNDC